MTTYKIKRTGNAALEFDGKMIATKAMKSKSGASRWHAASIYRTKGANLVMEVVYNTKVEGEIQHFYAKVTSPNRIGEDFQNYDPTSNVFVTTEEEKKELKKKVQNSKNLERFTEMLSD